MAADERKLAHIGMIQNVVTRTATYSFQMKGWAIVLVSGLFGLGAARDRPLPFVLIAFIPVVALWALDAYYLREERLFRSLYNHVRQLTDDAVDYSMDTRPFRPIVDPPWRTALSITLIWFYGPLLATVVVATSMAASQ